MAENKRGWRWLFVTGPVFLVLLALVLIAKLYLLKAEKKELAPPLTAHLYKKPSFSIEDIKLKLFYVIPKNRTDKIFGEWQPLLKNAASEASLFHQAQFRNISKITYDIYPEPVILEKDNLYYDTENTNNGNPEAIRSIIPELEERFKDFLRPKLNERFVIGLVYEGVGASGALGEGADKGAFILSRSFLAEEEFQPFGSSLFYHEFGHTLGFPDMYNLSTNQPFSEDIMGGGRRKPLSINYIDSNLLKETGIFPN